MSHGKLRHAPVEFMDLLVGLLVELARLGQEVAYLGVHFLLMFLEFEFLLGRELFQLFGGERFALPLRYLDDPGAPDRELEPELQRAIGGLGKKDFLRLLGLPDDVRLLFLVLLGVEDLGYLILHEVDEPFDVAPELAAHALGEADGERPVGVLEVVDVAPVIGRREVLGDALDQRFHDGVAARAGDARDEDVVSVVLDGEAELDGMNGARLPDDLVFEREVRRGPEGEHRGIGFMTKFGNRHFSFFDVHEPSFTMSLTRINRKQ